MPLRRIKDMGPQQYAAIGDTVSKGIGNMIDRKSNKEQLAIQQNGLRAQSDYINNQSDSMRDDYTAEMQPYMDSGQTALSNLQNTNTNVAGNDAMLGSRDDYGFKADDYTESDGYKFRLAQGMEGLDQGAGGDIYSSGQEKEKMAYAQNLASDEYAADYDRQFNEFQDANTQFQDARDYNTNLESNNLDRGINLNQNLNNQGYTATTNNADTNLGITQDQTAFGVDNMGQQYGVDASQIANRYGFASDQNKIANNGFQKFMGGSSFGG